MGAKKKNGKYAWKIITSLKIEYMDLLKTFFSSNKENIFLKIPVNYWQTEKTKLHRLEKLSLSFLMDMR